MHCGPWHKNVVHLCSIDDGGDDGVCAILMCLGGSVLLYGRLSVFSELNVPAPKSSVKINAIGVCGGLMVSVLGWKSRVVGFKSRPGQKFRSTFLFHLHPWPTQL